MNIKKVFGSFRDAVFYIGIAVVICAAFLGLCFVLKTIVLPSPHPQSDATANLFVALVVGIVLGLVVFFRIKDIKIEFDMDVAYSLLKMKKHHYNLLFLNWLQDPLRRLGTVSVDEYMLFVKDKLFGYYRGKDAQGTGKHQNIVKKPTWDDVHLFATGLLDHDNKYFDETLRLIGDWIRDRKREEIKW